MTQGAILRPADEFAHTRQEVQNWQENYVWHAWNPVTRSGFNLHLGNITEEGIVDLRAHVIIDGQITAGTLQERNNDCFAISGLDVKIEVAFEKLSLTFSGMGSRGPDVEGWFGKGDPETPFGFEIEMISEHPVWNAHDYPQLRPTLDLEGNHYELGARWRGRLWSGDTEIVTDGLLVRDHSWGGRVHKWAQMSWVPMVFDQGREFAFNWQQVRDDKWESFSVLVDSTGRVDIAEEFWIRLNGDPIPRRYAGAAAMRVRDNGTLERYVIDGDIHIPIGRHRTGVAGLSDMYSTVTGVGRSGFSTVQVGTNSETVAAGFAHPLAQFSGI